MRLSSLYVFLPVLASAALAAQSEPAPPPEPALRPAIQVRLTALGQPRRVTARAAGPVRLIDAATGELLEELAAGAPIVAAGESVRVGAHERPALRLEADALTVESGKLRLTYPEALRVSAARGVLRFENECSLESYTAGVLASECPALFHPEAIRAMAVAVRSYSYRKAFRERKPRQEGLCDTTHCHVYRGLDRVRPSHREAVRATAGQVALFEGEVIDAVYSADCGGWTEANEDAWKGAKPIPYLLSLIHI